ncbi:S8 family serine peptidase [candidate division WOR-3 bacterium]|nr:S8 family serine peptidase [candidate division WOR-3 bacterium]
MTGMTLIVVLLSAVPGEITPVGDRYVPGQMIVKFAAAMRGELGESGTSIPEFGVSGIPVLRCERILRRPNQHALAHGLDLQYLLTFDPSVDVPALVSRLSSSPVVEYACPDVLLPLDSVPGDTLYHEQWHLADINAPRAWAIAHGDSNVLTGMISDAPHWTHPDLEANIAINALEDLNGNRRFDALWYPDGDLNGVDDDTNGYIDDVIGYDFYGGDPFPEPTEDDPAGTHCLGVQNAISDNGTGVAAPPWNVRTYAMRCGDSMGISLSAAISAISYCVTQGVWAFSMNFGSLTPYPPLADACLAAWDAGSIPCAPAGHSAMEIPVYPAAYDSVIAVADCGRDHRKTPWSSYGTWIDVTAPGDDIYSTASQSGYDYRDGNIPACNIVVGILAWYKSAWPDITNDSAVHLLKNMCDTMPDSLYWAGKLGAGRVRMSVLPYGIAGDEPTSLPRTAAAAIVHRVLALGDRGRKTEDRAALLDACGRKVMDLHAGGNDVSSLSPGVYCMAASTAGRRHVQRITIAH